HVEAEDNILARLRIDAIEHAQHAPARIGLDFLIAHFAVQFVLVEALDTGLADMVRAGVVSRVEALELLLVDASDVTDRMGEMLLLRIVPHQLRRHLDTGQAELVDRDAGNLLLAQLEQDRHRLERAPPLTHTTFEQLPLVFAEFQYLDHRIEHAEPVTGTLTGHGQAEAGTV